MSVEKPTLTYFHLGGRGELPRLLLEAAAVDYHYHSIAFRGSPGEPWPEYKAKHEKDLAFGQIPRYQEPGGVDLVQSSSITRYIARKYGLNGSNQQEADRIDVFYEGTVDFHNAIAKAQWADESTKEAETTKLLNEIAPKHLAHFQRLIEGNGNGFLVGDKLSYADVSFFLAVKKVLELPGGKDVIDKFGVVAGFYDRVSNNERIKKFYASEPYKF